MVTDEETNAVYVSDLLPKRHPELAARLKSIFREVQVRFGYLQGTRDIWCRDYMPIQINERAFLRYRYFPDYLCGEYEDLITDIDAVQGIAFCANRMKRTDYVLDGGNVVHHRHVACVTDKIYRENPRVDRGVLQDSLQALLGVKLIVVPREPYDVLGHTDGMLRFVDETTVVVNDYRNVDVSYNKRLTKALAVHGIETILMPYKPSANGSTWTSAWGNYVNYLQVGHLILFPNYRIPADREAQSVLRSILPDAHLLGVDCRVLSQDGGVLNCVTWNVRL